ncbi:hypothetical protein A3G50_02570 [Candidatus Jorgensenbacteria bacterium RIFCSPLOWO2_12_FULL_42_11]|uniref:Uncharacterized protein n=1 Tax=Candidatus Jorgensenbacteria bacterium RIFCSPLOWO2_12_FULL_42_11 TaxID=1798473 RepID=A0A1F6C161_9BACT|nr:MAG: hypothetical protein A3G50_02570 [Candidatus Jorgensenbacteria bacterium RIFCSPLOWO2_12_FULL_42_11]
MGLRASRSSFQQIIPLASPLYILFIISLNTGRPGSLADWASEKIFSIGRLNLEARLVNSFVWDSIDKTCRSSVSEDLRQ